MLPHFTIYMLLNLFLSDLGYTKKYTFQQYDAGNKGNYQT